MEGLSTHDKALVQLMEKALMPKLKKDQTNVFFGVTTRGNVLERSGHLKGCRVALYKTRLCRGQSWRYVIPKRVKENTLTYLGY